MKRAFSALVVACILLAVSLGFAQIQTKQTDLHPQLSDVWKKDEEMVGWLEGPEHYFFGSHDDIDLNIIPIDDDLREDLDRQGTANFLTQILDAKNQINAMFDVGSSEVLDYRVDKSGDVAVVTLFTQQVIAEQKTLVLEKYIMRSGQAVHLELRWKNSSKDAEVEKAQQEFEKIADSDGLSK